DNAIRREIIPDVILPIMSVSNPTAILGSTYADGIYAIRRIMGQLFRRLGPSPRGNAAGSTVCRASLTMLLTDLTPSEGRHVLSQRGTKQGTAKGRLSHVCSKHTVNLWGYHRLQDQR